MKLEAIPDSIYLMIYVRLIVPSQVYYLELALIAAVYNISLRGPRHQKRLSVDSTGGCTSTCLTALKKRRNPEQ